jgi:hypothetical protein
VFLKLLNAAMVWQYAPKRREINAKLCLENLGANETIILKFIFKKWCVSVWPGFK